MKSIYLLFFSFAQLVFFSCSEQGIYINNVSNQVIQKDIAITRAISNLTPNCSLLIEIDENAQDTVLERLKLNIAREWYSHRKTTQCPVFPSISIKKVIDGLPSSFLEIFLIKLTILDSENPSDKRYASKDSPETPNFS